MTDEQIIKAKKIIKDVYIYLFLSQQKYRAMGFDFCQGDIECLHDLIDTITRQKAEIKKLENIERLATKTIETQTAEIERLNAVSEICGECHKQYAEKIERAKFEAIKEFAEMVKGESQVETYCDNRLENFLKIYRITDDGVNNLVKEMVGDSDS